MKKYTKYPFFSPRNYSEKLVQARFFLSNDLHLETSIDNDELRFEIVFDEAALDFQGDMLNFKTSIGSFRLAESFDLFNLLSSIPVVISNKVDAAEYEFYWSLTLNSVHEKLPDIFPGIKYVKNKNKKLYIPVRLSVYQNGVKYVFWAEMESCYVKNLQKSKKWSSSKPAANLETEINSRVKVVLGTSAYSASCLKNLAIGDVLLIRNNHFSSDGFGDITIGTQVCEAKFERSDDQLELVFDIGRNTETKHQMDEELQSEVEENQKVDDTLT